MFCLGQLYFGEWPAVVTQQDITSAILTRIYDVTRPHWVNLYSVLEHVFGE